METIEPIIEADTNKSSDYFTSAVLSIQKIRELFSILSSGFYKISAHVYL